MLRSPGSLPKMSSRTGCHLRRRGGSLAGFTHSPVTELGRAITAYCGRLVAALPRGQRPRRPTCRSRCSRRRARHFRRRIRSQAASAMVNCQPIRGRPRCRVFERPAMVPPRPRPPRSACAATSSLDKPALAAISFPPVERQPTYRMAVSAPCQHMTHVAELCILALPSSGQGSWSSR